MALPRVHLGQVAQLHVLVPALALRPVVLGPLQLGDSDRSLQALRGGVPPLLLVALLALALLGVGPVPLLGRPAVMGLPTPLDHPAPLLRLYVMEEVGPLYEPPLVVHLARPMDPRTPNLARPLLLVGLPPSPTVVRVMARLVLLVLRVVVVKRVPLL